MPAFDRARTQVLHQGVDPALPRARGQCLPGGHPDGVLRRDRRDRGRSEDAELMECLEIGLNAGGPPESDPAMVSAILMSSRAVPWRKQGRAQSYGHL